MAEIYSLGGSVNMYNVSYGVGEGMFNKPDDVMLLQWLLKHHFARNDKRAMLGKIWSIDVINGVYSKMLGDIIKIYQYDAMMNVRGFDVDLNGKVYPIQGCGGANHSVIVALNLSMAGHSKRYYENPGADPMLYSEAKAMFDRCGTV